MNDIAHASHTVRGVDLNRQISEKKTRVKENINNLHHFISL